MELDCRANGTFHFWKTGEAAETGLSSCLMYSRPEAVCFFLKWATRHMWRSLVLTKKEILSFTYYKGQCVNEEINFFPVTLFVSKGPWVFPLLQFQTAFVCNIEETCLQLATRLISENNAKAMPDKVYLKALFSEKNKIKNAFQNIHVRFYYINYIKIK